MSSRNDRTIQMIGEAGMERLRQAKVLIVGVGGVGSYAAEAIVRSGVGSITVVDGDAVDVSNINRQLVALESTVGRNKAEVMLERMRDINSEADLKAIPCFYKPGGADEEGVVTELELEGYDWIIDAIDDVDAKAALIRNAKECGVNIISAMGAAGKFETQFKVSDISKTTVCPLAKVMRKRLRAEGIEHLPVVFSEEKPVPRDGELGSMSYVPGAMGLTLAGYVIQSLTRSEL